MPLRQPNFNKWNNLGLLLLWLLTFFGAASPANAQTPTPTPAAESSEGGGVSAAIHSLDTSKFPGMSLKLDLGGADGFLPGLQAADVKIVENGKELPVESLSASRAKAQIVIALNPAMVMVNTFKGSNMYGRLQTALLEWAKKQPVGAGDDFNLAVNDGMLALHLSQPADLVKVLAAYQPNLYTVPTNLNSLDTALEMATDPNIPADVKKEILYISPAPAPAFLATVPALIERVRKAGVRVDVWLVSASPVVTARGAEGLRQLAEATGGQYFIFSGREELPSPDAYLEQIRGQYQLTYQSALTAGGQHSLALRVNRGQGQVESNQLSFPFDIQPPNPILLDPPATITMPVVELSGNTASQGGYDQIIKVLIEFPDGHPRPLKHSQLYVDGLLVAENTAPPFDIFLWNIREDAVKKRHLLQVKVEDAIGLSRASAASPVEVLENPASRSLLEEIASSERLLTASAIAAALLAILILLWLTSRRGRFKAASASAPAAPGRPSTGLDAPTRPAQIAAPPQISAASQAPTVPLKFRPAPPQPASKPVPSRPVMPAPAESHAAKRPVSFSKPARLKRLDQANKPIPGGEFLITRAEITIGSSPGKSILVIDLPSIDALHARLVRTPDDAYFLADCGSVGGTWVNFAPVSAHGVHLVDGDLIHFGRTPFRFELAKPDDALMKNPSRDGKG